MSTEPTASSPHNDSHTDNTSKSGFDALSTLGKNNEDEQVYFTYEKADGTTVEQLVRYPEVTYTTNFLLREDLPGIFHSSYAVDNFYFTDRIDEFAVIDPGKKALFVDVGLYDFCGIEFLDEALARTNTPWEDVVVFLTHSHDDHDGNAFYCLDKGAQGILMGDLPPFSPAVTETYMNVTGMTRLCTEDVGFYVTRLLGRAELFDDYRDKITVVHQGDRIEVGDYHFEVLETPGHTMEHLCLLEREKGILFAGDHILDTAPGLMCYYPDVHLLKRFLDSIAYLKTLDLEYVFMCHRDALIGTDEISVFLDKILENYERPINKMASLLESGHPLTIYELAQKYYSYLPSWTEQPAILLSRRVAVAFSYLEYLYDVGRAKRTRAEDGALEYWCD